MGEGINIKKGLTAIPKRGKASNKNVEEATIIEETKNEVFGPKDEIIDTEEIGEPVHKLNVEKKSQPLGSIEVEIDEKKKHESETIDMDFMDEESINNFVKKETKTAEPLREEPIKGPTGTTDEIRKQILAEEKLKAESFTYEDMYKIALFLINIIDTGVSTGLKWFSGNDIDTPFSITETKKKMLANQLAMILIKHSVKFKIEILFILGLVMAYAGPVGTAITIRKQKKKIEEAKNVVPPNRERPPFVKQETPKQENQENPLNIPRRKRGGQHKG